MSRALRQPEHGKAGMMKKLRVKFILINMAFVASILAVVLGMIYYTSMRRFERDSINMMAQFINRPSFERHMERPDSRPAPFPITPFFILTLKDDGVTITDSQEVSLTVSEETAARLVALVGEQNRPSGVLRDYSLRYLKKDTREGSKIIFADLSFETDSLRHLLITCLLIFFLASVLFLLLSFYLSSWALRPVETAWRQQNQFIADASHELKTPLTVILANLQILGAHRQSTIEQQGRWLDNTKQEAERMRQLVEELLFLARSDAGTAKPAGMGPERFDMSDTVKGVVLLFESVAFENQVDLTHKIQPDIQVFGNEAQIRQVLAILLDNACKYAGKQGAVFVSLGRTQHHAVLTVTNSGDPILPEELKHIFERFYRTDKSRARKEGGYGLGLSIARTLLEQQKGKITATSSPEKGTAFTVTLPCREK